MIQRSLLNFIKHWRIRRKLLIAFALVLLVPVVVISFYSINQSEKNLKNIARVEKVRFVETQAQELEQKLSEISADLLFLSQVPTLRRYVNLGLGEVGQTDMERFLIEFIHRSHETYTRICVLDSSGQEDLCVYTGEENSVMEVVPRADLRNRINEPYFTDTIVLGSISGTTPPVYISEVSFAEANGISEPILHYVTPLQTDDDIVMGVLVANVRVGSIFANLLMSTDKHHTYVIDKDGHYLVHPDFSPAELGLAPGLNIRTLLPLDHEIIMGQESGILFGSLDHPNDIHVFARIRPPGQSSIRWTLIIDEPLVSVTASVDEARRVISLITLVAFLVAMILAAFFVRSFTRPLLQLTQAAASIQSDFRTATVPQLRRRDEMGELTQTFDMMLRNLQSQFHSQETQIVELREIQERLQQSEERFSKAFRFGPMAMMIVRVRDWNVLDVNDQFAALCGYERSRLVGSNTVDLNLWVHPEQITAMREVIAEKLHIENTEVRMRHQSGDMRNLLVSITMIELQQEPCVLIQMTDITQRKRMEQHLHERNQALEALNSIAMTISSNLNVSLVMSDVLEQLEHLVPFSRVCVVVRQEGRLVVKARRPGQAEEDICPDPVERGEYVDYIEVVMEKRRPRTFWVEHLGRNWLGIPLTYIDDCLGVLAVISADEKIFDASQVARLEAVSRQLATAMKSVQLIETVSEYAEMLEKRVRERTQELRLANERLVELDSIKDKFIEDMAHELRTPLSVLNTRMYLMERSQGQDLDRHLGVLKRQVDHLVDLAQKVLDISRLSLGVESTLFQPVDINALIERVLEVYRPVAEDANLEVTVNLQPELPQVRGLSNQLAQALNNLVSNAIRYTREGSISITTTTQDGAVVVEIMDTGLGIDSEDIPRLFERFFRSQRVVQSSILGTGLGLAIVKDIIDLHQGQISVSSEQGRGSCFRLVLPL